MYVGVCCQAEEDGGGCCFVNFDGWASENSWYQKFDPVITNVLIHDDGAKLAVVGAYRGATYDEDTYHFPFVADFYVVAPQLCDDDQTFSKKDDASKDCAWVAAFPESRCLVKDDDAAFAFEQCKSACKTCTKTCSDDADWHKTNDPTKNCDNWVKRYFNRCNVQGQDGTFAYQSCSRSCQTCNDALPVH
jgi:hypothetical protein